MCLSLVTVLPHFAQANREVNWKAFDKGLKEATHLKKYTFMMLYTDWCGYCRKLEGTTLKDKNVLKELDKNFISIRLNGESPETVTWKNEKLSVQELVYSWGVQGFPTLLFLNSKGDIIGSYPSYADADLMLNLLKYVSSGAREKDVPFEDYLEKKGI